MNFRDIRNLTDYSKEDLLDTLGLAIKPGAIGMVFRWLGPFGAGLVCGAALALLFAPKPGRELRKDIREYLPRSGAQTGEEETGHPS